MNINKIEKLLGLNKEESKAISRSIHTLNDGHNAFCKTAIKNGIKHAVIDDMVGVLGIMLGFDALSIVLYKGPGLVSAILIDALLLTSIPFVDLGIRVYKTHKVIVKDRIRLKTETEKAKKSLDKCYQYICELDHMRSKIHEYDNSEVVKICEDIEKNPVYYDCLSTPDDSEININEGTLTNKLIRAFKINR